MSINEYSRFANLTFDSFKELAKDPSLSNYEKIGFPDSYREGREDAIFKDIISKLANLQKKEQCVLDIGPGCSELAVMLIEFCREQGHTLLLIDSQEMLELLPNGSSIIKIPAYYPYECSWLFQEYAGKIDVILTYSVFHYIFSESNIFKFLDYSLSLLADSGEMLIGDIPNISKRKRFFESLNGIKFHQKFTDTDDVPEIIFNQLELEQIDDAVLSGLIMRCRSSGFDAYWVPQADNLPMANRREDILIRKP